MPTTSGYNEDTDMAHFELIEKMAPNAVIKVIGVGGGGGNAVAHMVSTSVDGVEFITANTDSQAIKNCGAKLQLQLRTWCSSPPAWAVAPAPALHRWWHSWPRRWAS